MKTLTKRQYFTMEECGVDIETLINASGNSLKLCEEINNKYSYNWITFNDAIIRYEDVEILPETNRVEQWKNRFMSIYNCTKDKYDKLLTLYKSQEGNLLNKIGSSTTTKFNDTPQNVNVGDTDEYTSTYTNVSTEIEPGELIDRLHKIHNSYDLLMREWVKEFEPLFGESTLM